MEVDPKVIKRTQETLGNIIKKPTLTDKLLSRPPFRFLHDICTASHRIDERTLQPRRIECRQRERQRIKFTVMLYR
ncbi:unnamed protein product [Dicrocoelium dendriticum]|nr:unnamed protein product [Dicrocoelium dendriticum]